MQGNNALPSHTTAAIQRPCVCELYTTCDPAAAGPKPEIWDIEIWDIKRGNHRPDEHMRLQQLQLLHTQVLLCTQGRAGTALLRLLLLLLYVVSTCLRRMRSAHTHVNAQAAPLL